MKRFLSLFLLSLLFVMPVFAEIFFAPTWSEFCPKRYVNINADRWHYTSSGRYWSDRKKDFEQRLEKCNNLPDSSKEACYNKLREIENNLTRNYDNGKINNALKYMMFNSTF